MDPFETFAIGSFRAAKIASIRELARLPRKRIDFLREMASDN